MKRTILLFLFLLPLLTRAHEDSTYNGIHFEQGLTWSQILAKAKAENKYIFVDCFATWCGPCKKMDNDIYSNDTIGGYMNTKFISVKVQMDKTKKDNEQIQKWYEDAEVINKQYKLPGYPSFLFFSPEGKIVHKDLGYKNVKDFLALAIDALNPSKQYFTLLENYRNGKRDTSVMKQLALITKLAGDKALAIEIANEYLTALNEKELFAKENIGFLKEFEQSSKVQQIVQDHKNNYLDKLDQSALCTKENLYFIIKFSSLVNSRDGFFKLFYTQGEKVDQLIDYKGLSNRFVRFIIGKEEINSKLFKDGKILSNKPNWTKMKITISQKYNNSYAQSLVAEAQLSFYKRIENWREFARLRDKKIKENPPKSKTELFEANSTWLLNVDAWDVFLHCNDMDVLKKALRWIDLAITLNEPYSNDQLLDTKANILYKMGRVDEAIAEEQKAIEIGTANAKRERKEGVSFDDYIETIKKMKKGEPTWKVK